MGQFYAVHIKSDGQDRLMGKAVNYHNEDSGAVMDGIHKLCQGREIPLLAG